MHAVPQTIYTELLDEILASTVKIQGEFKIQSWKHRAKALKEKDFFQWSMLNIIILVHENKAEEAIRSAKNLFPLAKSTQEKHQVFQAMVNAHVHLGLFSEAIDWDSRAFIETKQLDRLHSVTKIMRSFCVFDERIQDHLKSVGTKQRESLAKILSQTQRDINSFESSGLDKNIYQKIIQKAFMIFYSHCHGGFDGMKEFGASCVSTILMNSKLDNETISKLNDEMVDALVDLSDEYSYEELLKYPIIFTSENLVPEVSING